MAKKPTTIVRDQMIIGETHGKPLEYLASQGHEFIRSTSYGSHFGSHVAPDYDFTRMGFGGQQDAVHVQTFNPTNRLVTDVHYTREAAETLCKVLALALGWPHIPGEK